VPKFTCLLTPGRSGSTFLYTAFNQIPNTIAHESYYVCTDNIEQCFSSIYGKSLAEKNRFIKSKIEYIENLDCEYYVDTVSLICQDNNLELFIDNGYKPNVITLRRDPRDVALSWYSFGWDPTKSPLTSVNPNDKDAIKITLQDPHDYQYCLWYCFEIERLCRQYKTKLESWGVKHYETSLSNIIDKDKFNLMLDFFEMPNISEICQGKINELNEFKVRSLENHLIPELQQQFLENIRDNNDIEFFDMDQWNY
jgi:hypothetical protein